VDARRRILGCVLLFLESRLWLVGAVAGHAAGSGGADGRASRYGSV
jgi:hypothetical protein